MKNYILKTVATVIFLCLLVSSVSAQTFFFQSLPKNETQLGLRYLRPNFKNELVNYSTYSGVYDLSLNTPLSSKYNFVFSIPYIAANYEGYGSQSSIGNIYIGLQTRPLSTTGKSSNVSFGLFLPTTPENNHMISIMGVYANNIET